MTNFPNRSRRGHQSGEQSAGGILGQGSGTKGFQEFSEARRKFWKQEVIMLFGGGTRPKRRGIGPERVSARP